VAGFGTFGIAGEGVGGVSGGTIGLGVGGTGRTGLLGIGIGLGGVTGDGAVEPKGCDGLVGKFGGGILPATEGLDWLFDVEGMFGVKSAKNASLGKNLKRKNQEVFRFALFALRFTS
jgi:hypothetical protein